MVNRDLTTGTARRQVEEYLDAKGWSHSYTEDSITRGYYGKHVGLQADQLGGVVFANVPEPNVGIGGLDEGTITVLFFLNHDGRLLRSYVVERILSL